MQDDKTPVAGPPASHDDVNRPGMTNGVPDEGHDDDAKGAPHNERGKSERAAGKSGRKS